MDPAIALKIAVALGLGLLVGLQRERTAPHVAGLRTITLITVFGTLAGLLTEETGGWLTSAGLVVVAAMLIVGYFVKISHAGDDVGLTTQASAMVMYLVGVALALDHWELGILVAGSTAVLLHWKKPLHALVRRFGEDDISAIFQLVLIALVILPILPNENYGPYRVLNPFEIWMMVVLIVGISLVGVICSKFFGINSGAILSGLLGGMISSTATTLSYARRSRANPNASGLAALVITIASTVVIGRVLIEVAVVAPNILPDIYPPLVTLMGLMIAISIGMYFWGLGSTKHVIIEEEPSELKAAITFGMLYAAVLFAVAATQVHFGDQGLYVVAALSGLTDMDAITLSTAQMIEKDRLDAATGWRMIMVSALSNLVFKGAAVAILGHRRLLLRISIAFGLAIIGGVALLILWQ